MVSFPARTVCFLCLIALLTPGNSHSGKQPHPPIRLHLRCSPNRLFLREKGCTSCSPNPLFPRGFLSETERGAIVYEMVRVPQGHLARSAPDRRTLVRRPNPLLREEGVESGGDRDLLGLPAVGYHRLHILTPTVLELFLVTTKAPDAPVDRWDF